MVFAWPSPFILKITKDKENYNISEHQASYFTVINTIGLVTSLQFTLLLPDRFGRKPTLMLTALPFSLCWILKLFFTDLYMLYFARFLSGIGEGLLYASLPLYIGEVATPEVRGTWGNALVITRFLGQFLMNIIGTFCNVKETSLLCLIVPVVFLVSFYFMPESPYFYIMKDKDKEARDSLRIFLCKEDVEEEYSKLKADVKRQMSESGSFKDLFLIKSNRRALYAGCFLRVSQTFSGIMVFVTYTQFLFTESGGDISPSTASMLYTGLACVLYIVAASFSDGLGRKKSYLVSLILTAITLIMEAVFFYLDQWVDEVDMTNYKWVPIAGMLIFLIFASFGVGIIPTLMLSELYSASIKAKAISAVMSFYSVTHIVSSLLFYHLTTISGLCGPFLLFGLCNICSALLSQYLIPETKGKTLEDIQQILKL